MAKQRCNAIKCVKSIEIINFKCRCNNIYCSMHRLPETHDCSYNFKKTNTDATTQKQIENMKCVSDKLIRI